MDGEKGFPVKQQAVTVATGFAAFGKRLEGSVDLIGARAVRALFTGSGISRDVVDEVYVGSSKGGSLIAQRSLRFAGLATGLPIYNVENACASSAVAFQLAVRAIEAGQIGCALVLGVDQLSSLGRGALPVQATEWDGRSGLTNPAVYAMRATRYMEETGATPEDLAAVAVKSRSFSDRNPVAQQKGAVTVEQVLASRPIADPLTLLQCSPKSDGAAAVLVMAQDVARKNDLAGPVVRASVLRSGEFSMAARDITRPDITTRAASAAFDQAGLGPEDLDVVELHDAFTIAEILYVEELGLCSEGEGGAVTRSGATSALSSGPLPLVNPSGGLIGRGHPIGPTGIAQIAEVHEQLMGWSGSRQRENARVGLAHVTGGGASGFDNGACVVTILSSS